MMKMEEVKEKRRLVIPGEIVGAGKAGHGTYEERQTDARGVEVSKAYAKFVGLAESKDDLHFIIPLTGIYNPKRGDGVIGKIEDVIFSKWIVDINSPYEAVLPLSEATEEFIDLTKTELTRYFDYSDLIFAEITSVTKTKNVQLSMKNRKCRKLKGGRLITVTPAKVPRIIGRQGSMVEMIKELTGTQIVVGQNGLVWVRGDNEDIAAEAVLLIEEKSHITGLTDFIKSMLDKSLRERGSLDLSKVSGEGESQ